jgi:hypothetical protein
LLPYFIYWNIRYFIEFTITEITINDAK